MEKNLQVQKKLTQILLKDLLKDLDNKECTGENGTLKLVALRAMVSSNSPISSLDSLRKVISFLETANLFLHLKRSI